MMLMIELLNIKVTQVDRRAFSTADSGTFYNEENTGVTKMSQNLSNSVWLNLPLTSDKLWKVYFTEWRLFFSLHHV